MNKEKHSYLTNKLSEVESEIKEFIIDTLRQHGRVSLSLLPDSDEEDGDRYPIISTLCGKHDNPQIEITDVYLDEHGHIYADGVEESLGTKEVGFFIYSEQYSDILYFIGHVINNSKTMNINAKYIETFGAIVSAEIEINTPNLPEINGQEVAFYLFDGYGIAKHEGLYLEITYPLLYDTNQQVRSHINASRFGNRLENNFKVTVDDLALYYGEVIEIDGSEYNEKLISGLISNAKRMVKKSSMSVEEFESQLRNKTKIPCRHLYIFKDDQEFLKELDGKIYAISDLDGNVICDVLEEDMLTLEDKGIISDNQILSADSIELIRSSRVEIIFLNK